MKKPKLNPELTPTKPEAEDGMNITLNAENSARLRLASAMIGVDPADLVNLLLKEKLSDIVDEQREEMLNLVLHGMRFQNISEAECALRKLHAFELPPLRYTAISLEIDGLETRAEFAPGGGIVWKAKEREE